MTHTFIDPNDERIVIDNKGNFIKIRSAGVICKRVINNKLYFLLVKQNDKWSFPKGGMEKNESDYDCAIREFYEEVGVNINTIEKLKSIVVYHNTYFILNTTSNNLISKEIIDELYEISINSIKSNLNYRNNKYNNLLHDNINEITDISWIDIETIRKYLYEFNADVRVLVDSNYQHWFHIKVFGKKFINTIFSNNKINHNLLSNDIQYNVNNDNNNNNEYILSESVINQIRLSPIHFEIL
jgi:8-oxo-dGTP diphosphatase